MKLGTTTHPKFRSLMRSLSLPQYAVVGVLESLWMLASQFADDGDISRFTSREIADYVGYDGDDTAFLEALIESRWIDRHNDTLTIHDWEDHCPYFVSDRIRKREKSKKPNEASGKFQEVPGILASIPNDSDPSQAKSSQAKSSRFTPPTLDEVRQYWITAQLSDSAERFVDYYSANGWRAGRTPMKDWRAASRNWSRRAGEFPSSVNKQKPADDEYDDLTGRGKAS